MKSNTPLDIITPEQAKRDLAGFKLQCIHLNGFKMKDNQEALRLLYNRACHPDSIMWNDADTHVFRRFSGIRDKDRNDIYQYDIIQDTLTKAIYEIKYGFCQRYAYTGWYCENADRQISINNDGGSDHNSQIIKIGNVLENADLLKQ